MNNDTHAATPNNAATKAASNAVTNTVTTASTDDNDFSSELVSFESLIRLTQSMAVAPTAERIFTLAALSVMGKLALSRVRFYNPEPDGGWATFPARRNENATAAAVEELIRPYMEGSAGESELGKPLRQDSRYLFPVPFSMSEAAYLVVDTKSGKDTAEYRKLSSEELRYIELVLSLVISAVANHSTKQALRDETQTAERHNLLLTNLFHINKDFATLFSAREILKVFSYYLMGHLQVARFAVVREADPAEVLLNRFPSIEDNKLLYYYSNDNDKLSLEESDIRLFMQAEIRGEPQGGLFLGNKLSGGEFSGYDMQYLRSLINTTFTAMENARLFEEQLKLQVIEGELELARTIQHGFLPTDLPVIEGYESYGKNISAKSVGGDYYDVIRDKEGNYTIVMADVSGKGVPASLIMANLQSAVRLLVRMGFRLETVVEELNTIVCANTSADKFVTLCLSLLKPKQALLKNCTAGHPPPIQLRRGPDGLYRASDAVFLKKGGMVLGVVEGYKDYESEYTEIAAGDVFVYYTDGFTDGDLGDKSGQDVFLETVVSCLNDNRSGQKEQRGVGIDLQASVTDIISRMSQVEGILPDDMTIFLLHKT